MLSGRFHGGRRVPPCNGNGPVNLAASPGFVGQQDLADRCSNPVALKIIDTSARQPPIPAARVTSDLIPNQDEHLVRRARSTIRSAQKHSIFGRFTSPMLSQPTTYDGKNPLTQATPTGSTIGSTRSPSATPICFGSNMVNSFRVSANRTNIVKISGRLPIHCRTSARRNISPVVGHDTYMSMTNGRISDRNVGGRSGQSHNGLEPVAQ